MQHSVVLRNMNRLKWLLYAEDQLVHRPARALPFVKQVHVAAVDFVSDLYTLCK